jgi:hypothetical protein
MGRPHRRRDTDRHTTTARATRRRARRAAQPAPHRPRTVRSRDRRPRQPLHPLHRCQPARGRRPLRRPGPHPQRPRDRRRDRCLTVLVYPGEVVTRRSSRRSPCG